MDTKVKKFMLRKLIATFVSTTIFSFLLALLYILQAPSIIYNQGNQFIGWFFVYFIYIGAIILIYGNLVSAGTEYLQRKWFRKLDWLYVTILGIFGLANGVFFGEITLAYCGMVAAILYGIIDKWLNKKIMKNKSVKMFFLAPIALLVISWVYFQISSPTMSPFTKEDAVDFATKGEGTVIENFPKEIGQWTSNIEGYQVQKETSVKEIKAEVYMVSFTERWYKGAEKGSCTISYKVSRGSLTAKGSTGKMPPYYGNSQY
jgi:hypothetical protein